MPIIIFYAIFLISGKINLLKNKNSEISAYFLISTLEYGPEVVWC